MRKILIVYPDMTIGGSTTSLLSILNLLDYSKYSVDLLLGENRGELLDYIPKEVNLLKQALPKPVILKVRKLLSPRYNSIRREVLKKGIINIKHQYMNYENARFSRKMNKHYDIAIAFLETYACDYVADFVNADVKVVWLHTDYLGAGFVPDFDRKIYEKFKRIVLVSKECKLNFDNIFPEFRDKSIVIENILSTDYMRKRAKESVDIKVDKNYVNLITVCRIEFRPKGLDRGIEALASLKRNSISNIRWYIVGEGQDYERLKEMIIKYGLSENVFLLGKKINPAPYLAQMDAFFLPSYYEGKPMAVTEAMMLGIPAIVTRYASATEQISNGTSGLILNNSQEAIEEGLRMISQKPEMLYKLKENVEKMDLSNIKEMRKVYEIME